MRGSIRSYWVRSPNVRSLPVGILEEDALTPPPAYYHASKMHFYVTLIKSVY